jgi:hypothetical protein
MEFRLPIIRIIKQSLAINWSYRATLLRVLAAPIFIAIIYNVLSRQFFSFSSLTSYAMYSIFYLLLLTFILVNCHRIFLLGSTYVPKHGFILNRYFFTFFLWEIILITILFVVWYILIFAIINISISLPFVEINTEESFFKSSFKWIETIAKIIALYFIGRICLVLPSAAIGGTPSFKWSWKTTKNNGWRIFLLISFLPWLFTEVLELFYREKSSVFEQVALSIISYLIMTVEVAFLSLSFKAFRDDANRDVASEG